MFKARSGLSYCKPGLSAYFAMIRRLITHQNVMVVRYEDILSRPEYVKQKISDFSGFEFEGMFQNFHTKSVSRSLNEALNTVRPIERKLRPAWMDTGRLERALMQEKQYPEMTEIISTFGYRSTKIC